MNVLHLARCAALAAAFAAPSAAQDPAVSEQDPARLAQRIEALERELAQHKRDAEEVQGVVIRALDATTTRLDQLLTRLQEMDEALAEARSGSDPADPTAGDGDPPEVSDPGEADSDTTEEGSSVPARSVANDNPSATAQPLGALGRSLEALREDSQLQWLVLGGLVVLLWAVGRLFSGRAAPAADKRRALDPAMSSEEAAWAAAGASGTASELELELDRGPQDVPLVSARTPSAAPAPEPPTASRGTLSTPIGAGMERLDDRKDVVILGPAEQPPAEPGQAGEDSEAEAAAAETTQAPVARPPVEAPDPAPPATEVPQPDAPLADAPQDAPASGDPARSRAWITPQPPAAQPPAAQPTAAETPPPPVDDAPAAAQPAVPESAEVGDDSEDDFLLLWDDVPGAEHEDPVILPLEPEAPRSATTVDQDGALARLSVPGVDHERAARSVREAVAGESWVVQSPPPEVVCRNGVLEVSLRFLPNTPAGERSRILARARRAIL